MTVHAEHAQAFHAGSGLWSGLFRLIDPKVSLASISSMAIGAALVPST